MADQDDDDLRFAFQQYPPPKITPAEFESVVAELFEDAAGGGVENLTITTRDRLEAPDGSYVIDATVRYRHMGLDFLVLVEAKMHGRPVERDVVQILHAKLQSTGGHKGVVVSKSGFQSGALDYAEAHRIALVNVVEGRFIYEKRSAGDRYASSEEARQMGLPSFAAHCYAQDGTTVRVTLLTEQPESTRRLLLDVPDA